VIVAEATMMLRLHTLLSYASVCYGSMGGGNIQIGSRDGGGWNWDIHSDKSNGEVIDYTGRSQISTDGGATWQGMYWCVNMDAISTPIKVNGTGYLVDHQLYKITGNPKPDFTDSTKWGTSLQAKTEVPCDIATWYPIPSAEIVANSGIAYLTALMLLVCTIVPQSFEFQRSLGRYGFVASLTWIDLGIAWLSSADYDGGMEQVHDVIPHFQTGEGITYTGIWADECMKTLTAALALDADGDWGRNRTLQFRLVPHIHPTHLISNSPWVIGLFNFVAIAQFPVVAIALHTLIRLKARGLPGLIIFVEGVLASGSRCYFLWHGPNLFREFNIVESGYLAMFFPNIISTASTLVVGLVFLQLVSGRRCNTPRVKKLFNIGLTVFTILFIVSFEVWLFITSFWFQIDVQLLAISVVSDNFERLKFTFAYVYGAFILLFCMSSLMLVWQLLSAGKASASTSSAAKRMLKWIVLQIIFMIMQEVGQVFQTASVTAWTAPVYGVDVTATLYALDRLFNDSIGPVALSYLQVLSFREHSIASSSSSSSSSS